MIPCCWPKVWFVYTLHWSICPPPPPSTSGIFHARHDRTKRAMAGYTWGHKIAKKRPVIWLVELSGLKADLFPLQSITDFVLYNRLMPKSMCYIGTCNCKMTFFVFLCVYTSWLCSWNPILVLAPLLSNWVALRSIEFQLMVPSLGIYFINRFFFLFVCFFFFFHLIFLRTV